MKLAVRRSSGLVVRRKRKSQTLGMVKICGSRPEEQLDEVKFETSDALLQSPGIVVLFIRWTGSTGGGKI